MPRVRHVYLLDPRKLSPETLAVSFAKTSRSPLSFAQIAAELTDEKSADFHEKWVVGYGHASVAEHAVLHIAVENISRLAVECLESNRLASYTEKSTRYQQWGKEDFHIPAELQIHPLKRKYFDVCRLLLSTYERCLDAVRVGIENENPRLPSETDQAWDARLRTQYIDICRFLLPASSLTNVGLTINARALEHAISKMLSNPLVEVKNIGKEMKSAALTSVPTLVKYGEALPYLEQLSIGQTSQIEETTLNGSSCEDWCRLLSVDSMSEEKVLAAFLYRINRASFNDNLEHVKRLSVKQREELSDRMLGNMGAHDQPIRELEYANFTFEIILDQGAYYELKRHRMMTLTSQPLTTNLGYAIPKGIVLAGLEKDYCNAMLAAHSVYSELEKVNPYMASYIVPNGFNRRVLVQLNLRTAFHLLNLRTESNAHFSLRRVAQSMLQQIRSVTPILGKYIRSNDKETADGIQEKYFHTTHQTCA